MEKYKVTFLFDKNNLWFYKTFKAHKFNFKKKFTFKITKNATNVKNQDIVFPLCYTKILKEKFIKKNKLVIIPHPSKLPAHKGFAPLQHQILKDKKIIHFSLIKAVEKVDEGPICLQTKFKLKGTELNDEIREIQGKELIKIITKFLSRYPKIKFYKQKKGGNFNKRRYPIHSELNINKTIKEQFNHFRINDNENYPSFFKYLGKKYIIKIFQE
jgi:methionyl-tRNA formyltransferase